jgi:protein TonB
MVTKIGFIAAITFLAIGFFGGCAQKAATNDWALADVQPEPIKLISPIYPPGAAAAGFEGTVMVKVFINTEGLASKPMVIKDSGSDVGFEEAAIEAAKKGKWKPATKNGKPIGVWVAYPISFTLNKEEK